MQVKIADSWKNILQEEFEKEGIEIPFPHRTLVFQNSNPSETMDVASAHS